MEIRVESLKYVYADKTPWQNTALNGISFFLPSLSVLGILGSTGSGKTTLLKNLNGLLKPTAGRIFLNGKETASFRQELPLRVGLVFQCPERQLFEDTVLNEVSFPIRNLEKVSEEELLVRSRNACEEAGLDWEAIKGSEPSTLPEAARRKLAIACVLVNDPGVLILDEPLAGMDPYSGLDLVRMAEAIKLQRKRTMIIVSHDMAPFMTMLDFLMVLDKGRLEAFGECGDVFEQLSSSPRLFELAPPMAHLKHRLKKLGLEIPKNEFDPCLIAGRLSEVLGAKDFIP